MMLSIGDVSDDPGVYAIRRVGSREVYVGQTFSLSGRFSRHAAEAAGLIARKGTAGSWYDRYPGANFVFMVLVEARWCHRETLLWAEREAAKFAWWCGLELVNRLFLPSGLPSPFL